MGLLMWFAGIVILLPLNENRSAAQSSFAPNTFMMLLSISIASGPRWGDTEASTGKDLLPRFSAKQIHPRILRGVPSALRNAIAPGGMANVRLCRNFAWLRIKVCAIQGIFVAESMMSWCSTLSPSRVPGMRILVDGNRVVQDETPRTADW